MGIDFQGWIERVMEDTDTKRPSRRPSDEDLDSWDNAATKRHDSAPVQEAEKFFVQLDALLKELHFMYPVRARRVQRDIKWLRSQAYKHKLPWGKKGWWQP